MRNKRKPILTPHILLSAYSLGIFPRAERSTAKEIFWVDPTRRGILPLHDFHISRSLKKAVKSAPFDIYMDRDFPAIIEACRAPDRHRAGRMNSWINDEIYNAYCALAAKGYAHSIEAWQGDQLCGGLYGVSLGAAFFGESMFSRVDNASKIALVYLVARLKAGRYQLLDTQFGSAHLARFGGREISRKQFHSKLKKALAQTGDFYSLPVKSSPATVLQLIGHKS